MCKCVRLISVGNCAWNVSIIWQLLCYIWDSDSSDYEEYCLPVYDNVWSFTSLSRLPLTNFCCVFGGLYYPEDEGSNFYRNVCKLPDHTALNPTRQYSSYWSLWEPPVLYNNTSWRSILFPFNLLSIFCNKKFYEEPITCFPLIIFRQIRGYTATQEGTLTQINTQTHGSHKPLLFFKIRKIGCNKVGIWDHLAVCVSVQPPYRC
jgi:hypothetical protein